MVIVFEVNGLLGIEYVEPGGGDVGVGVGVALQIGCKREWFQDVVPYSTHMHTTIINLASVLNWPTGSSSHTDPTSHGAWQAVGMIRSGGGAPSLFER